MRVTASAISLNVADIAASAEFARRHLGFTEDMKLDEVVSMSRPDTGFQLVLLPTGLSTFRPTSMRGHDADGVLVVLVVDGIDDEYARIRSEGVPITTPIETEPWGERYFQVTDPNGVVFELVEWVTEPPGAPGEGS
ncbi:VOC family protein [Halostreptopolyspora alba]|uniref:Glyoxalase n=1 Tax=Halostreptopolyspora alba TaxID=2487137 RepID=A0A3N0EAY9_9ACTN|nr:glyoxalase [Nocardiopsaceae bacterium YIM 96095]